MQAASQKIELITQLPKKFILGDKQRVQQVCMNLLSNAVKFTQDGTITVKAWIKEPRIKHKQSILIGEEANNKDRMGFLYVSVKDTGVGIPKKE